MEGVAIARNDLKILKKAGGNLEGKIALSGEAVMESLKQLTDPGVSDGEIPQLFENFTPATCERNSSVSFLDSKRDKQLPGSPVLRTSLFRKGTPDAVNGPPALNLYRARKFSRAAMSHQSSGSTKRTVLRSKTVPKVPKVVLLIESSRASGRALLRGVANYTHHHRPWSFYWEPRGLETSHGALKKLDADGVIFRDIGTLKAEVLRLGIPAVVISHASTEVRGLINVVTDSTQIGYMAADHLLRCGFRHFAFFGYASEVCSSPGEGLEQTPWSTRRLDAFRRRILEAGFSPPAVCVLPGWEPDWPKIRDQLADWLVRLPTPLGVMACNDDCAVQVVEACKLAGLAVPDVVGIVGADNDEVVCGLAEPPLTSIALNFERAGYEAAEALDKLMRRSKPQSVHISVPATHLVARRSTDVVAVEDERLAKALRFIRNNVNRPVSVDYVATAAGASRRVLERRFREVLGRSVLHEIRRVRANEIARLLVETNWPIGRIADTLGFEDDRHFSRYFYSIKNLSPIAFRKKYGAQLASREAENGDFLT